MKLSLWIALGLVPLLVAPVAAQDGPIAAAVKQYGQAPAPVTTYRTEMRSPVMFWSGVALASGGALSIVAAVTWAQQSDLSLEDANTRLGRDLAPCGTDINTTRLPVADCQVNHGLLWLGAGMLAAGGTLMIIGGDQVQIVETGPRAFAMRVRF